MNRSSRYDIISGASHQPTNFLEQYRIYIDKTKAPWEMISAPTVLVAMLRRCKACNHDLSQQLMTSRWKRDVFGPEIVTPCLFGSWQTQPLFHWHLDSLHLNWSWLKLWLRFQGRLKCIGWSHTASWWHRIQGFEISPRRSIVHCWRCKISLRFQANPLYKTNAYNLRSHKTLLLTSTSTMHLFSNDWVGCYLPHHHWY